MIITLTPHMALEHNWIIPGFGLSGVYRSKQTNIQASGKGINVARGIQTLGGKPICMGFLAGHIGQLVAEMVAQENLDSEWTWVTGETRSVVAIIDPLQDDSDAVQISEEGPPVDEDDWKRLKNQVVEQASKASFACICGSFPPGSPLNIVLNLVQELQTVDCPVWIDTTGPALRAAARSGAAGIKINANELGAVFNKNNLDQTSIIDAGQQLLLEGANTVVVTMGAAGAILLHKDQAWIAKPPPVRRLSSIGCGDVFLAGLLTSLADGAQPDQAIQTASAAGAANALSFGAGKFSKLDFNDLLPNVLVKQIA